MGILDPYHDKRPYHKAKLINANGRVSPLCAKVPRPLNLRKELWTYRNEAVTCKKCLALLPQPPSEGEAR